MDGQSRPSRIPMRRFLKRIPAYFEGGGVHASGHILRLSREGMFLGSETLPAAGTDMRVTFADRLGNKIEVEGNVRWNTSDKPEAPDPGFGMHIPRPSDTYQEFYEKLVTS